MRTVARFFVVGLISALSIAVVPAQPASAQMIWCCR